MAWTLAAADGMAEPSLAETRLVSGLVTVLLTGTTLTCAAPGFSDLDHNVFAKTALPRPAGGAGLMQQGTAAS